MMQKDLAGTWYELRPFIKEYKDPLELMNLGHNFIFVLHKDLYTTRIYMKAKNISSTTFEAKKTELPNLLYNENWVILLRSVHLIADVVHRNRMYELLSDSNIQNTTIVVSAKKILFFDALQLLIRRETTKKGFRIEGRKKELLSKNEEPLYITDIYISTENYDNVMKIKELLPMDHVFFRYKRASLKKINRNLNRNLSRIVFANPIGTFLNVFGVPIALDTVLNRVELANLVQLPLNPTFYNIISGESRSLSQGFNIEKED